MRRIVGALWVLTCTWLLVRTLLARNSPSVFGEVEEAEILSMIGLSAPLSLVIALGTRWASFSWWIYPHDDARTILGVWLCFFAIGCLQWFVLVPLVIQNALSACARVVNWWQKK
jgi:hypothetical protein